MPADSLANPGSFVRRGVGNAKPDAEILDAVLQQSNSGTKAKEDLLLPHNSGTAVIAAVPTANLITPSLANPASVVLISSREDVLTRATAVGCGATSTGFQRFLTLTEAAKDRKDGSFRKLFNT